MRILLQIAEMKIKQGILIIFFALITPLVVWAEVSSIPLKSETELLQEQIANDNRVLYLLIAGIVIAFLTILYLYSRTQKINLQNKRIKKQGLQLKDSEKKYHEIFDCSLDSIITTDPEGLVTNLNKSAETMLGYSSKELIGKNIKIVFASDEESLKVIEQLIETDTFSGEILNKTKDGTTIITRLSANQVRNRAGEVIGTMGISRDITKESILQEEYDKLINNVSDIIYTTDLNGNFTYTNKPVESILGFTEKEIVDKSFRNLIIEDDLAMVASHFTEVFQQRLKESYLEFRVRSKNGKIVWVGQQVNTKFNKINSSKIEGFYGIVRVIDERKRAELKLQGSEKKYRDLIDSSSDLIQIVDHTGKLTYVNQAWKRTLKYTKEDLEDLNISEVVHPDSIEDGKKLFESIVQKTDFSQDRTLYTFVAKDGEKILVEGSVNAKYDMEGNVVSIQSFLRDVTLQKEAQKLLAQKENTLRQITETINDVFYLYNILEKKYEYISPNCENTLGANEQFFYDGRSHTKELGLPEDIAKLKETKYSLDEGGSYDINFRVIVNGEIRWINEKSFAIRDEEGKIVANSGICRDITDIREANETIRIQNLEIGSSILYAKRIQDAVLPLVSEINNIFPNSFVIFKPKDVVSGDFYIVEDINTNNHTAMPIFIVGDCTGHGVPGAVLSLMCNVLVRESFARHDVNSPADALNYVRTRLTNFFRTTQEKNIRDGMDIAFCVIDYEKGELNFSGANSKCILVRNGELSEYRGNRQHVGYDENPDPFTNQTVKIEKGDRIYLYSDGYTDQFGGDKEKKFGKLQLHNILKNAENLSMTELGELLTNKLEDWQGTVDQVDDITFLGVQV